MEILTPLDKVLQANLILLLDSRAGLTTLHKMKLVAVVHHAVLNGPRRLDPV